MQYNTLGGTGLIVSQLCLGTMTFGGQGFWQAMGALGAQEAEKIIGRALDKGVNFIDTADVYSEGVSEQLTGQALKNLKVKRSEVVVATKVFGKMGAGPNTRGSSRAHILDGVKASLARLGLDYIDLYQLHGFDALTPPEETLRALDDLVREGLVRYIGCSNWHAWQIMKSLGLSDRHGWSRFASLQAYYSIAGRDLEREIVPMLKDQKVGLMVWSPLAGGLLSGKFEQGKKEPEGSRRASFDFPPVNRERAWKCIDAMRAVAQAKNASVAQVALAWLLHQDVVSSVIIGAKTPEQLDDNLKSVEVKLDAGDLAKLAEVSALPTEYPAWMLERQGADRIASVARSPK